MPKTVLESLHYCQVKTAPSYNTLLSAIMVARGETMWNYKESGALLKEYDSNNNLIHVEHISGIFEAWYEYDDKNRQIHYKDSNGEETWFEYYENGVLKNLHQAKTKR